MNHQRGVKKENGRAHRQTRGSAKFLIYLHEKSQSIEKGRVCVAYVCTRD